MPDAKLVKSILSSQHPDYKANVETWKRNEALFAGGDDVYDLLKKFTWEETDAAAHEVRKEEAVYVEFPALMMEKFVGMLDASAPTPNFGTLGEVRADRAGAPTKAELVWDNADGTGSDARSWAQFWKDAMAISPATEFRWVFVEAPPVAPRTEADELSGLRPYVVEFSPVSIPNWLYTRGQLDWARIELQTRAIVLKDGEFTDETTAAHYLLVRKGYSGLGTDFEAGGWWMFDSEGKPILDANGQPRAGNWDLTRGEIPMTRLYYEKRAGVRRKGGLSHIGRLSVRFMNLLAALFNDAWVSGQRQKFIAGVSSTQWKAVIDAGLGGGIWVPIPSEPGTTPQVFDTGAVSASGAITAAMKTTLDLIERYVMRELSTSPDASGRAREVELIAGNSPRLAHMAGNLEEAQRATIRFLELRFGAASPSGSVTWPREFDLRSAATKVREAIESMRLASATSPTLATELVVRAVRAAGIDLSTATGGEDEAAVEDKIRQELRSSFERTAQADALAAEFAL